MDYTSCHPDLLYRDGGFFEDPEQLSRLRQAVSVVQDCDLLCELYPAYQVVRPMPEVLLTGNETFHENLLAQNALLNRDCSRGAASALVVLYNATIYSSVIYTTSAAGFRTVYETYRKNDRPYLPLINSAQAAAGPIDLSDPDILNVFLGSVGSFNYGHWLVDDLPRIKAFPRLFQEAGEKRIRVLITSFGEAIDRVRIDTLLHLCKNFTRFEVGLLKVDKIYRFDALYYITPISYHPVLKGQEALAFLVDRMATAAPVQAYGKRIFITRRPNRSRALINLAEVEERLNALGFRSVDVEDLNFIEQAQVFGQAEIIVGCMGAAMTNCLFAPVGTWTLYLGPEGWMEPFYWDIAAVRGHHYLACYGPLQDDSKPAHLSAYSIDLGALETMLARVLTS